MTDNNIRDLLDAIREQDPEYNTALDLSQYVDPDDLIHKVFITASYDDRSFLSRLLFLKQLFENTFDKEDIIARSVLHKLKVSLESAEEEAKFSLYYLEKKDPESVMRYLKHVL